MAVQRMGMFRSECKEEEGTDGDDGGNDSDCCIKCMQLIVKCFF